MVDSIGYTYNVKECGKVTTYWQCIVCPKGNYCKATVKQTKGNFILGSSGHKHPAEAGALLAAKIRTSVKRKAVDELFRLLKRYCHYRCSNLVLNIPKLNLVL